MNDIHRSIVIDVDDTVLNLGDRRIELFRRHFPRVDINEDDIRRDVGLSFLGDRNSPPSQKFLCDLFDQDVVSQIAVSAVPGSSEAIASLRRQGFDLVFITGRHVSLREDTVNSLKGIGLEEGTYSLYMDTSDSPSDPAVSVNEKLYKQRAMQKIASEKDIVAAIGDRLSDIQAAIDAKVPAILFDNTEYDVDEWERIKNLNHVGVEKCDTWEEVLIAIGRLEMGSSQMEGLRDMFTQQYSSWLQNLNTLAAIDVTIASLMAVFASQTILNGDSLHVFSRLGIVPSLILSLLSLVFAIRAFTARYTSGKNVNNSIIPTTKQIINIFLDNKKGKYKEGDAYEEFNALKSANQFDQSRAHLDFFYQRYGTYNPRALLNIRLYEMRAVNYAKAYPEHISSTILVWNIAYVVMWVIVVAIFDPSISIIDNWPSEAHTEAGVPAEAEVPAEGKVPVEVEVPAEGKVSADKI